MKPLADDTFRQMTPVLSDCVTTLKPTIEALLSTEATMHKYMAEAATVIPACAIIGLKKQIGAVRHVYRVVPKLTEDGKRKRIDWALGLLETRSQNPIKGASRVQKVENFAHFDEKWFDKEKPVEKYLLFPGEHISWRAQRASQPQITYAKP